jgi:hypothetical protein
MEPTLAALLPVLSLSFGVVGTLVVERLRDGRLERRESEARRQQRAEAQADRRDGFELENLRALMAAIDELLRASFRHHFLDRQAALATGTEYGSRRTDTIPGAPELGERLRVANVVIQTHIALVMDDVLREDLGAAVDLLNSVAYQIRAVHDADAAHDFAAAAVNEAQMRVAERIREIYIVG